MTDTTAAPPTELELTAAISDAIADFQRTAQLSSLQHAQMRQYLAEHLAGALALRMGVTPTPEQVRAATLTEEADQIVAHCPDHGSEDGVWMDCHCAVADDMRRRAAVPAAVETGE